MSFDQNNGTKNATFDNELIRKYVNNKDKSEEINSTSVMEIKNTSKDTCNKNDINKKLFISEIANAI